MRHCRVGSRINKSKHFAVYEKSLKVVKRNATFKISKIVKIVAVYIFAKYSDYVSFDPVMRCAAHN
jgi:hypothetical protein